MLPTTDRTRQGRRRDKLAGCWSRIDWMSSINFFNTSTHVSAAFFRACDPPNLQWRGSCRMAGNLQRFWLHMSRETFLDWDETRPIKEHWKQENCTDGVTSTLVSLPSSCVARICPIGLQLIFLTRIELGQRSSCKFDSRGWTNRHTSQWHQERTCFGEAASQVRHAELSRSYSVALSNQL